MLSFRVIAFSFGKFWSWSPCTTTLYLSLFPVKNVLNANGTNVMHALGSYLENEKGTSLDALG